ncbi:MAG: neutral/alkaline non-lysosomal ceramidase N-terminal domain-containing protein [Gemmataceae bacterium]
MPVRHCLLLGLLLTVPCRGAELRAGAARVDITPPTGFPMWGYAARRDAPCVGVRDRLHARALVLEAGGRRMAVVSLDLGRAPTRDSTAAIRAQVRRKAGVDTVFLVASHTHHGPALESDAWPTPETSYVRRLEERLTEAIVAAARSLRPARLGVASRQTRLNRNRHSRRGDAPVDRELLVLRVEDERGRPIAHAVNFAAHPTMLPTGLHQFSADYAGALSALIESKTAAPCLFLQGAAGDLSPNQPPGGTTPERFAATLADEVFGLIASIRCERLADPTLRVQQEEFRFASRVDLRNPLWRMGLSAAFYPALIAHFVREYRDGVRPALTVALLDGRIGFVGVSGEFFCGHALHLKRRARLDHLFFLGYCNDYHQYFPTIEALSEGGYGTEVYISPAEIGAGERVMDRALQHLYQLRGKLRQ